MQKTKIRNPGKTARLMFEGEASFGRINKPKYCWCSNKFRSCVPCHHISKGVQVCFWCGEAFNGGKIFFSYAKLRYKQHECFFKGII